MGFRNSPESERGTCGVCGAGERSGAAAESVMVELPQIEEAGLKPGTTSGMEVSDGGASAAKNVGVRVALFALRCYKAYLSVLFAGTCRFEPTCSQYAYQAIERFGVFRGMWLGSKRLARCHPFSGKFGFDPIPDESYENIFDEKQLQLKNDYSAAKQKIDRSAAINGTIKDGIRL